MIEGNDPLAVVLSDVAALGTDRDRAQIAAVHDRLVSARLRVLVAGEAKRGKSSLVNAFLGQAVLPVGVTPLTAVATTVRYGDDPHVHVRFADGHEERHPHAALDDLVTEHGNPANRRGIVSVTVYVDAPVLADGVELVDTPGTGSVFAWDTLVRDALVGPRRAGDRRGDRGGPGTPARPAGTSRRLNVFCMPGKIRPGDEARLNRHHG